MPDNRQQHMIHDTTIKCSSAKLMNKIILIHILIFITCQISSFHLLGLNIKLFWKTSPKNYDLSFNVHLTTRQRINTSDDIVCVAGI